jgi:mutator protein MutT
MRENTHVGVYAVIENNQNLVLIKKNRGPYKGLLDLPGGKIEYGETPETALIREVKEETNLNTEKIEIRTFRSNYIEYQTEDGEIERLQHFASIYKVEVESLVGMNFESDGEDSDGAGTYEVNNLDENQLTPFAFAEVVLLRK